MASDDDKEWWIAKLEQWTKDGSAERFGKFIAEHIREILPILDEFYTTLRGEPMTTWQHEVAALHAKLDHILVILADPVVPLQYEEPWPTEPGGWWWVMDSRESGFVGIIMRAVLVGDEIKMQYGGSFYPKGPLDQFWSFAGPITQMPREEPK